MVPNDARTARLRSFLSADPHNVDLACDLADALIAQGLPAEAREVLEALPAEKQAAAGVRFRLARIALVHGDYAAAEAIYRRLIAEGHESAGVWHDLAFGQLCQRRADEAMESVRTAIAHYPADPALFVLEGRIALMQGDFETAKAALDRAVAIDSDHAAALGVRALALFDHNDFNGAAQAARECLGRHPDQHEALLVAGTQALWAQQLDTAQTHFERALTRHPNSGRVLSGYGQLLMLRNDLTRARQVLEHAVRTMPDHIGTWHALAWTQLLQGDSAAAEASYRRAYALDRNFGDSHGGLALIDALRGNFDEAELGIKRALRLDPNAVTARYAKTLVLDARGDHEASEALLGTLIAGDGVASQLPVGEFAARLKSVLGASPR
jgi:Tfp pilus assembly protein PilF